MSPQDHERLLEGSPAPAVAAASSAAPAEIPQPRRAARTSEEKAGGTRARTGAARRSTAAGSRARAALTDAAATGLARARSATARAAATRAAAKAAAPKAAAPKAAAPKAAAPKAATAAKPAPKKTVAARAAVAGPAAAKLSTSTPRAAGPAAAKATATKTTATKTTATKTTATKTTATKTAATKTAATKTAAPEAAAPKVVPAGGTTRPRPTPYPRSRVVATTPAAPAGGTDPEPSSQAAGAAAADSLISAITVSVQQPRGRHRRIASRRPAMVLAAALVAALGFGGLSLAGSSASAQAGSTVSVAHELGLTAHSVAQPAPAVASRQLGLLAASRAHREAEQAAAAYAQRVADARAIEAARPKAVLPVAGAVLTSGFGYRWGTLHAGIDLAAPMGTPEYAVMDGVVLKAGPASGFGQAVYIQHANGDVTVYGHMEKILVTTGQVVRAGQEIALLGAEGEATGPHLHFEVHVGGIEGPKIDPIPWLRARGVHI